MDAMEILAELRGLIAEALEGAENNAVRLELLKRYVALDPESAFYRFLYGRQLCILGCASAGERVLLSLEGHELGETKWHWQLAVARLYEETGRFDRAEGWFARAVESNPSRTEPYVFLGSFLAKQERFPEALTVLARATSADGDVDEVYLNIGNIKRALGDYAGAIAAYQRAIQISPDYVAAAVRMSDAEEALRLARESEYH